MRTGIFQCAGGGLEPADRLDRLAAALAREQLDLVACPELFMSGYNVGEDVVTLAEPSDGPFARRVAKIAQNSGTAIVYGYPEKADGTLYNSAACIDPAGKLIANHRKLVLPPGFESQHFACGDQLTLFDFNGVRFAILICYDAEHPEAVRAAVEAGAQVVIVPTALIDAWNVVAYQMIPTRAFENGVWLLYANHAGAENGASYLGASCIVAPDGKDAARATVAPQATGHLICADVDIERVIAAQTRLPYLSELGRLREIINGNN